MPLTRRRVQSAAALAVCAALLTSPVCAQEQTAPVIGGLPVGMPLGQPPGQSAPQAQAQPQRAELDQRLEEMAKLARKTPQQMKAMYYGTGPTQFKSWFNEAVKEAGKTDVVTVNIGGKVISYDKNNPQSAGMEWNGMECHAYAWRIAEKTIRQGNHRPWVRQAAAGSRNRAQKDGLGTAAKDADKPRIALIMKSLANEFFRTMEDGARAHQKAHSGDYTLLANGIKNETDAAAQIKMIEQAVAQKVQAIVLAPADSKALVL